jgi:hypothetical protein
VQPRPGGACVIYVRATTPTHTHKQLVSYRLTLSLEYGECGVATLSTSQPNDESRARQRYYSSQSTLRAYLVLHDRVRPPRVKWQVNRPRRSIRSTWIEGAMSTTPCRTERTRMSGRVRTRGGTEACAHPRTKRMHRRRYRYGITIQKHGPSRSPRPNV